MIESIRTMIDVNQKVLLFVIDSLIQVQHRHHLVQVNKNEQEEEVVLEIRPLNSLEHRKMMVLLLMLDDTMMYDLLMVMNVQQVRLEEHDSNYFQLIQLNVMLNQFVKDRDGISNIHWMNYFLGGVEFFPIY